MCARIDGGMYAYIRNSLLSPKRILANANTKLETKSKKNVLSTEKEIQSRTFDDQYNATAQQCMQSVQMKQLQRREKN